MCGHRVRYRGFTLVELLVVVAILGLLIALVVPSLRHTRENARSALCACQLREVGHALEFYAEAHADGYPTAESTDGRPGGANWWENPAFLSILSLTPRPQGPSLITCPADAEPHRCRNGGIKPCWSSYGANTSAFGMRRGRSKRARQKSQIRSAAQALAFCDARGERSALLVIGWQDCVSRNFAFRHLERCTAVYLDTHVGWIGTADIPLGPSAWERPFWANVPCFDQP